MLLRHQGIDSMDALLRKEFTGSPTATILAAIRTESEALRMTLPDVTIRAYAEAIRADESIGFTVRG